MADLPRGAAVRRVRARARASDGDEAVGCVAVFPRHGERHAGRRDADGPDSGCIGLAVGPERRRGGSWRPRRHRGPGPTGSAARARRCRRPSRTAPAPRPSGRSRSPENGAERCRRRARRAKAAQAREPHPSATSSGRRSGAPDGRDRAAGCGPPGSARWSAASTGRRSRHPATTWSGSTKRCALPMSRPRLRAAICIQSAPSPRRASAIRHRPSPGWTMWTAVAVGAGVCNAAGGTGCVATATREGVAVAAPAPDANTRGVPAVVRASTPTAMRAAIRSSGVTMPTGRTSPCRTCTATPRTSCEVQAAHAIHAATANATTASRGQVARSGPARPTAGRPRRARGPPARR